MIRKYWQQGAGDTDRNYAAICLKWDVILNGPGYAGAWPECGEKLRKKGWSSRKITDIKRFSSDMKDGDVVVLRLGTSTVLGIGIVVGDYEWLDTPKKINTYTLKQVDTTQKLDSPIVLSWINSLKLDIRQCFFCRETACI